MSPADDPLALIISQREKQRALCRQMEEIADRLPVPPGQKICQQIRTRLKSDLPAFNRNEEMLYSLLAAHWPRQSEFDSLLSLIRYQHNTHIAFADEFDELVLENDDHVLGCGYMLRYFFETLRSHLDWEDAVFMPYAASKLGDVELRQLVEELTTDSKPWWDG